MVAEILDRTRLGPYVLTKRLAPGVLGERYLALHEDGQTSHLVHRFRIGRDRAEQRRFLQAMDRARGLDHPHILRIEAHGLDARGKPWAVTPFTGDRDGVVTLDALLRLKGGSMPVEEAKRAIEQLLAGVQHAHEIGQRHGPMCMQEVQVDRRGSLAVELYGVARLLSYSTSSPSDEERLEVLSVIQMGYQLVTGLRVEEPIIPAGRVVPELDQTWDDFFETGLGEPGFTSAAHALSVVQGCRTAPGEEPGWGLGRVRVALRRLLFAGA